MKATLIIAVAIIVGNDVLLASEVHQSRGCTIYNLGKLDSEDWTPSVEFTNGVSVNVKSPKEPWKEFSLAFEAKNGNPNGILKFWRNSSVVLTLKQWDSTNNGPEEETRKLPKAITEQFQLTNWTDLSLKCADEKLMVTIYGTYDIVFLNIDATSFHNVYGYVTPNNFLNFSFNCPGLDSTSKEDNQLAKQEREEATTVLKIEEVTAILTEIGLHKLQINHPTEEEAGGGGAAAVIIILLVVLVIGGVGFWYWKKKKRGKAPTDGFLERVVCDKGSKEEEMIENDEQTSFLGDKGLPQERQICKTEDEISVHDEKSDKEESTNIHSQSHEEKQPLFSKDAPYTKVEECDNVNIEGDNASESIEHDKSTKVEIYCEKEMQVRNSTDDTGYKIPDEVTNTEPMHTTDTDKNLSPNSENSMTKDKAGNPSEAAENETKDEGLISEPNDAMYIKGEIGNISRKEQNINTTNIHTNYEGKLNTTSEEQNIEPNGDHISYDKNTNDILRNTDIPTTSGTCSEKKADEENQCKHLEDCAEDEQHSIEVTEQHSSIDSDEEQTDTLSEDDKKYTAGKSNKKAALTEDVFNEPLNELESLIVPHHTTKQTSQSEITNKQENADITPDFTDDTTEEEEEQYVQVIISKPEETGSSCPKITTDMNSIDDYTSVAESASFFSSDHAKGTSNPAENNPESAMNAHTISNVSIPFGTENLYESKTNHETGDYEENSSDTDYSTASEGEGLERNEILNRDGTDFCSTAETAKHGHINATSKPEAKSGHQVHSSQLNEGMAEGDSIQIKRKYEVADQSNEREMPIEKAKGITAKKEAQKATVSIVDGKGPLTDNKDSTQENLPSKIRQNEQHDDSEVTKMSGNDSPRSEQKAAKCTEEGHIREILNKNENANEDTRVTNSNTAETDKTDQLDKEKLKSIIENQSFRGIDSQGIFTKETQVAEQLETDDPAKMKSKHNTHKTDSCKSANTGAIIDILNDLESQIISSVSSTKSVQETTSEKYVQENIMCDSTDGTPREVECFAIKLKKQGKRDETHPQMIREKNNESECTKTNTTISHVMEEDCSTFKGTTSKKQDQNEDITQQYASQHKIVNTASTSLEQGTCITKTEEYPAHNIDPGYISNNSETSVKAHEKGPQLNTDTLNEETNNKANNEETLFKNNEQTVGVSNISDEGQYNPNNGKEPEEIVAAGNKLNDMKETQNYSEEKKTNDSISRDVEKPKQLEEGVKFESKHDEEGRTGTPYDEAAKHINNSNNIENSSCGENINLSHKEEKEKTAHDDVNNTEGDGQSINISGHSIKDQEKSIDKGSITKDNSHDMEVEGHSTECPDRTNEKEQKKQTQTAEGEGQSITNTGQTTVTEAQSQDNGNLPDNKGNIIANEGISTENKGNVSENTGQSKEAGEQLGDTDERKQHHSDYEQLGDKIVSKQESLQIKYEERVNEHEVGSTETIKYIDSDDKPRMGHNEDTNGNDGKSFGNIDDSTEHVRNSNKRKSGTKGTENTKHSSIHEELTNDQGKVSDDHTHHITDRREQCLEEHELPTKEKNTMEIEGNAGGYSRQTTEHKTLAKDEYTAEYDTHSSDHNKSTTDDAVPRNADGRKSTTAENLSDENVVSTTDDDEGSSSDGDAHSQQEEPRNALTNSKPKTNSKTNSSSKVKKRSSSVKRHRQKKKGKRREKSKK